MRHAIWLVIAAVAGCIPPVQSPNLTEQHAAQQQAASNQMVTACQANIERLEPAWCSPDNQRSYASDTITRESSPVSESLAGQLQSLRAQCAAQSLAPALAKLDGCIAAIAQLERQERAAQDQRMPEVRRKEPAIRADPAYASARRAFDDASHALQVASDNLKVARAENNADVASYESAHARADADLTAAGGRMRELLRKYDIDPRDARRIGL